MKYQPDIQILEKYADVLVNFALNSGQGIKPDEVVFIQIPESAKPMLLPLQNTVLKAGAHPIIQYLPDGVIRDFFTHASDKQRKFFPEIFLKGKVEQADHLLMIIADSDLHELEGIDPKLIMEHQASKKPYMDWRNAKENQGKLTWTLGLYPTPAMAKEAGISLKTSWNQVIKACYLDQSNSKQAWRDAQQLIDKVKDKLNKLPITKLRLQAKNTDLIIKIDQNRRWLGGDGRNIPSFEIFISPDWRGTNGHIFFDQPLYRDGNLIKNIYLEFNNGVITKATAEAGEKVLKEMIAVKNADKIGEFSLTDKRLSKIDKFMAETLYDENFGGKYGNTHLALGMAYQESFPGKIEEITPQQWQDMGYNDSVIHTDIISTSNRTVTATLENDQNLVIYRNGMFTF